MSPLAAALSQYVAAIAAQDERHGGSELHCASS